MSWQAIRRLRERSATRVLRCQTGVSATEFALLAPVLILMLVGSLDMTQMVYANTMLRGAVEQAARDSSLEAGDTEAADKMVADTLRPILPGVLIISSRASYYDFGDIGRPEKWEDRDLNGTCNDGEPYTDENSSGTWEADIGADGNGGAGDVVIYTVRAQYEPTFRVPFVDELLGGRVLSAASVRKNQPFARQTEYGVRAGTC